MIRLLLGLAPVVFIVILVANSQVLVGTFGTAPLVNVDFYFIDIISALVATIYTFLSLVGQIVIGIGQISPMILGLLTCLTVPLAALGLWALGKLKITASSFGGYGPR